MKFWKELCDAGEYDLQSFHNPAVPMKTGIGVVRKKA
jgi:hypothetical protein